MKSPAVRLAALLLLLSGCWTAPPARAHRPYTEPVGEVVAPDGRRLRLEILFGDGILWDDPGRGQLRDERGRVVGRTPVSSSITASCMSGDPTVCRVFTGCGPVLPRCVWVPDFASMDWEARTFVRSNIDFGAGYPDDPYPEYDKAPAPVGFARDLVHERREASLIQKPFMIAYFGPFLAFSLLIGCWTGAVYATRRLRLAELRWRGGVAGSRLLGAGAWAAVVVLALPFFGLGMLVEYWKLPIWFVAVVLGCAVALRRLAERLFLPAGHWARGDAKLQPGG